MKVIDHINYSINSLKRQKIRTWLTIIGVFIGAIALFLITSASEYVKHSVSEELSQFGANNILIIPVNMKKHTSASITFGASRIGKLFTHDLNMIKGISGIKDVNGFVYGKATVSFKGKSITTIITGSNPNIFDTWDNYLRIERGRVYTPNERNVVVIGYDVANDMFGKNKVNVGNHITINGRSFRVIGILEKIGTTFSKLDDSAIYVPIRDARDILSQYIQSNEVSAIVAKVEGGYDVEEVKNEIEEVLDTLHKTDAESRDFTVMTERFIKDTVGGVLGLVNTFITIITIIAAGISAFGIANTMYTSVVEKRKEIGILKAIGARDTDIQNIFLIESAILSGIGGGIGILLGSIIIIMSNIYVKINMPIPIVGIFLVMIFSICVGLVSGYHPSKEAARVDPIKAINETV